MGLLCDYFLASDDDEAAATIEWAGGPSRPPSNGLFRKSELEAHPTLALEGVEPVEMMGTLEQLLTGRLSEEMLSDDPGLDVAAKENGERFVLRMAPGVQDALTLATDDELREVAQPWSETAQFWGRGDPAYLGELLVQLASMVRQGLASGRRVYCWVRN
jgi:hypothetical protein